MAENKNEGKTDAAALQAENEQLKGALDEMQKQIDKLSAAVGAGRVTREEKKAIREKKAKAKAAAAAKRDKEAEDTVDIQKFNRDGELVRERTCAKVDIETYKKQGWKAKK